jgi:hypothetical protein
MRAYRLAQWIFAGQLLWALSAFGQGNYKVETIGTPSASDLPKALVDALETNGVRLVDDHGAAVADVWLRKSIPTKENSAGSSDTIYSGLGTGTIVGVLRFPNGGSDFRGQSIKAGSYTLRYALVPQDGNHMGVSTYRDFLVLSPVAADTEIDKPMTFEALVALSKKASGTNHPAVLSLNPATESKVYPTAVRDDQGHWALQVKAQGNSGAGDRGFAMAIILVGKSEAA